jgi:nitrite reductase/ring-hydroxylating ferredoxin subunit
MSERWIRVCKTDELKPGQARTVKILGKPYAVFNVNGELHGLDSACRHMRANLATGKISGNIVTCFMHRWTYEISTGRCTSNEGFDVAVRPVKCENSDVFISVEWPDQP